jgi:hypothetical protein
MGRPRSVRENLLYPTMDSNATESGEIGRHTICSPLLPSSTKSLITVARAHVLSRLQILCASPAGSASRREMQAVGAKSVAVPVAKLTVAAQLGPRPRNQFPADADVAGWDV